MAAKDKWQNAMSAQQSSLHHMMCKKVAQLTKVIFHLNSKNEDQEFRLQELQRTYEAEIESIVALPMTTPGKVQRKELRKREEARG